MKKRTTYKLYSPKKHILLAEVTVNDGGAIVFNVKRPGKQEIDEFTLDELLSSIFKLVG